MSALEISRDAEHVYRVNGQKWPSVTQIIERVLHNPSLANWREHVGEELAASISRRAAMHGTLIHELAAQHAEGEFYIPFTDVLDEEGEKQIAAFREWMDKHVQDVILVERFVAHERYRYAGQLDLLCRFYNTKIPVLVDLKSGGSVSIDARAQTMAYLMAAREMGVISGRCRRGVLWVPGGERAGKCIFQEHTNASDEGAFMAMLTLWHWLESA